MFSLTDKSPVFVPDKLEDLLGFSAQCSCGIQHSVEMKYSSIRADALDDLPQFAKAAGNNLRVIVVADNRTRIILGDKVSNLLKKDGHRTAIYIVEDSTGGRPHADDNTLDCVVGAMRGADLAVAAGSGTINDLTKAASFQLGIPYIVAATAPSMNGYTSSIAALMIKGIKRTVPCAQPVAVVADLNILKDAPLDLISSGLADLESKPTATADYRLGAIIRGDNYCSAPEKVVLKAESKAAETSEGLVCRDIESVAALTEALILSGFSMKLAGSSGPASGGEHLISHFWDMTAHADNREEGLHGAQVGVATILTATLYEHLRDLDLCSLDIEKLIRTKPTLSEERALIKKTYGNLAKEVIFEYEQKRPTDDELKKRLVFLQEKHSAVFETMADVLRPASVIRSILKKGKAPVTVFDLKLTPSHLKKAFLYSRYIRNRYTVLDLAFDLGVLENDADTILEKSGCLKA